MGDLICAQNLCKTYRRRVQQGGWIKRLLSPQMQSVNALDGVSFAVREGEMLGFIGPNGAGKSTTIKILSGILTPDAGTCSVLGLTPWQRREKVVARIGVVFGQRSQLWWDLPVRDSFSLLRDIFRVEADAFLRTQDELVDRLSLGELMHTQVRQLSLGQRMRCELAAALLHSPRIVFLDEPTIGLDAVSKLAVRDFLKRRNREDGMTAILTTHDMDDVEAICTRVLLIGGGRILMDGSVQELLAGQKERRITATLQTPPSTEILPDGVSAEHLSNGDWSFRFNPQEIPAAEVIALINEHGGILDLMVENPPIDEVIASRYRQLDAEVGV